MNFGIPVSLEDGYKRRSPFDDIRQTYTDDQDQEREQWSARDLFEALRYTEWRVFLVAIERARDSIRNIGEQVGDHFVEHPKMVALGSGSYRKLEDFLMSRLACYMVANNGNPKKPEVAAAQAYFVTQARRAELALPPVVTTPAIVPRPWYERVVDTFMPHKRWLNLNMPGSFTVVSALVTEIMTIEDEGLRHRFPLGPNDRPDISVGLRYSRYRASRGMPPAEAEAPLELREQNIVVMLKVYPAEELTFFLKWFQEVYMPELFLEYADGKKEWKPCGPVPRASFADAASDKITGRPAVMGADRRAELARLGGFVPAQPAITAPPRSPTPRRLPPKG